jgi:hypothetical protein
MPASRPASHEETPLRPLTRARLGLAAAVIVAGPLLSACDSLDSLDMFDSKKKLVGDRKPVFPEGVPGVSTGVPAELVKGYREPEGGLSDPARAAAAAVASDGGATKPKPQRTASKPKPKPSSSDQSAAAGQPAAPAQQAPAPWPSPQQPQAWPGSR